MDQPSIFALGLKLVDPGNPSRSYLFEKINSSAPQQGTRMRPSDAMSLADQALIRDWIIQLAPSYENFVWTTFGVPSGSINTGVADDFNGDGVVDIALPDQGGASTVIMTLHPTLRELERQAFKLSLFD